MINWFIQLPRQMLYGQRIPIKNLAGRVPT
jgi:hypothetical protein